MSSSKKQSSLDSFFGKPKAGAVKKATIKAPFGEAEGAAEGAAAAPVVPAEKENSDSKGQQDHRVPMQVVVVVKNGANDNDNDDNAIVLKRKSPAAAKKKSDASIAKRRRRVIEDDDSSDEDMPAVAESEKLEAGPETESPVVKDKDIATASAATATPVVKELAAAATTTKPKPKTASIFAKQTQPAFPVKEDAKEAKEENETNDISSDAASTLATGSASTSDILKAALKGGLVKSDAAILKAIDQTIWPAESPDALPYLILCRVLSNIDDTTKRLEIQVILTTLFRQIMLKSPTDFLAVMYLASNSVAPAYDCVELGIGDAILIKAIGEAYGTSTAMVKERYEIEGDLGTVAMLFKSTQRTLGGFFQSKTATKKKILSVQQVLEGFRTIAKTKGNQSQKFKVDIIKKLLVKSTDAIETKYIIRGLQGKLRIGLAESTVLISLAHSLALTNPPTVVLQQKQEKDDDDDDVEEDADDMGDADDTEDAEDAEDAAGTYCAAIPLSSVSIHGNALTL